MFSRKQADRQQTKTERRVAKLPTDELILWGENALYAIGKDLTSWQRHRDAAGLGDAALGAEALVAVVAELQRRSGH